jgi:signal transduction histidine kinase
MHVFLANNRDELIARCKAKVAKRSQRQATEAQLRNGIPMFLDQLQRTLKAEEMHDAHASLHISGSSGGHAMGTSEIGVSAAAHGRQLLELGFTVDQVVHAYGDLCQSITDLAFERDAPFGIDEFRTLNRCLDNAIAEAVTEFNFQRETALARQQEHEVDERVGLLVEEIRNALSAATLAASAIEVGNLSLTGATGGVLKRGLAAMNVLVDNAVADVRARIVSKDQRQATRGGSLVASVVRSASLYVGASGCTFTVAPVEPDLHVLANRDCLHAALGCLLQNAFKFTQHRTEVSLSAHAFGDLVNFEVSDHCGGLPPGDAETLFSPFKQRRTDRLGLGLGLTIARQTIEADGGTLQVRNQPGTGCTFVISMPRVASLSATPVSSA